MLLTEVLDQLTFGELSQLYVAGRDEIGIQASDYEQIIPYINLGLTELYKRFDLKRDQINIQQDPSIEIYHLHSKYAVTNTASTEPVKYLIDASGNPFSNDVLRIEQVVDSFDNILTLNDLNNQYDINALGSPIYSEDNHTVLTPSYLSIQSTYTNNDLLTVKYRAKHSKIPTATLDLTTQEVDIPYSLLEALLYYIGARYYTNMTGEIAQIDGNNFMMKFEQSCKKVEELGLENILQSTNNKLISNGWV